MSEKTGIQWTDHTFNIAWGCTKISPGCANCYADAQSHRYGFDVWGPKAERRTFGEKHWNEPLKWNRDAEKEGRRHRVFCSSMCDVFEDHPTIGAERLKLAQLVLRTPWLDWQILTKRADRMKTLAPLVFGCGPAPARNVWLGVSVERQEEADARIPILLRTPAAVRFVSAEPLLGPVSLDAHLRCPECGYTKMDVGMMMDHHICKGPGPRLDWIIVGGESGPHARPFHVRWADRILEDCAAAGISCFMKQLGADPRWAGAKSDPIQHASGKNDDPSTWPESLRVRQFPSP